MTIARSKSVLGAVAATLLLASASASAESVSFGLSSDSFRFGLVGPLSRLLGGVQGQYDLGYMRRSKDGDNSYVAHAGLLASGDAGIQDFPVTAGVGLRGVFAGGDNADGGAIAPGVQASVRMPGFDRFVASVYGYYAPGVVSFGDLDSYRDLGASLSYELNRSAAVTVGYRNTRLGLDGGPDVTIDNGFFAGIGLTF